MVPLRVLMVSYEFPPLGGGIGIACMHLLRELAGDGRVHIDLVTSGSQPEIERSAVAGNIEIHKLPTPKRDPQFWRAAEIMAWTRRAIVYSRRLAAERSYDLCHCWAGWPSGLVGWWLRGRLPYIVALRGSDVPGYNPRLRLLDPLIMRHVARQVWHHAMRIVALSRDLRAMALRTQADAAIDIISNGVDTTLFRPADVPPRYTLVFAGRLIERKGVHHLVEALEVLSTGYPEVTLAIVGGGPQRSRLESLVRCRGLQDRVRFYGQVGHDRLAEIYRDARIFVLPSAHEALGNVVLEAMASGLAVITTRTGASELIRDNGIVIEAADRRSLATAVERYLDDPALLAAHRRNSRRLAETMSWSAMADWYIRIYREAAVHAEPGCRRKDLNPPTTAYHARMP